MDDFAAVSLSLMMSIGSATRVALGRFSPDRERNQIAMPTLSVKLLICVMREESKRPDSGHEEVGATLNGDESLQAVQAAIGGMILNGKPGAAALLIAYDGILVVV